MSERIPQNHEQHEQVVLDPSHEITAHATPERQAETKAETAQKAEQARATIEQSASEKDPVKQLEKAEKVSEPATSTHVNRELKDITLRRELQNIRRQESAPQRVLSRVIHQPAVRVVSEAAGRTVSRPSGLLGGGLVALTGTSIYLFTAKYMGFKYNYAVFTALFIGGFAFGLILELLVWAATAPKRRHATE